MKPDRVLVPCIYHATEGKFPGFPSFPKPLPVPGGQKQEAYFVRQQLSSMLPTGL